MRADTTRTLLNMESAGIVYYRVTFQPWSLHSQLNVCKMKIAFFSRIYILYCVQKSKRVWRALGLMD